MCKIIKCSLLLLMAGWAASMCRATETTTNAFALKMHSIIVPALHFSPNDASEALTDPLAFSTGAVNVGVATCSNQHCFAIHARNLTMLEVFDLLCFLSDCTYAFGDGGLTIAPTNGPTVQLKQSAKKEKAIIAKMKGIRVPEVPFRPPATIVDAIDFFFTASAVYDDPAIPVKQRGVNFAVKNPCQMMHKTNQEDSLPQISSNMDKAEDKPGISALSARFCTLYEALSLVCDKVDARFVIRDNTVVIYPAANTNLVSNPQGR